MRQWARKMYLCEGYEAENWTIGSHQICRALFFRVVESVLKTICCYGRSAQYRLRNDGDNELVVCRHLLPDLRKTVSGLERGPRRK